MLDTGLSGLEVKNSWFTETTSFKKKVGTDKSYLCQLPFITFLHAHEKYKKHKTQYFCIALYVQNHVCLFFFYFGNKQKQQNKAKLEQQEICKTLFNKSYNAV